MSEVAAEVGSTANNYQILARLALGGMAEIFLARGISGTGVERYCVLKRILRDRANDVHFVRMFLDEARLASQLQHPNVAQVYDIGKLGDSYFFTMEYVHGETVRTILHRARSLRREIPIGAVMSIVAGSAAGLHHAHERIGIDGRPLGIVHRDVSPSNLMVSYEGGVKVVDFGVAKAADRMQETRSGTVKGKISYLSPEQCRGQSIDRRSDLFSLGIVMWEMLATERLYKRASDFENMTAIVTETTPPPSTRRAGIPPELDAITMRLLSKDPNARFQSAEELVEALEDSSARTGMMISSSALGRFLREMFGQRPEPWLDLDQSHEAPREGVTVTSEPIPKELAIPVASDADQLLSSVPTLGAVPRATTMPPSQMMTSPQLPVGMGLPLPAPPHSGPTATVPASPNARMQQHTISSGSVPPPPASRTSAPSIPPLVPPSHSYPSIGSSSGHPVYPTGSHSAYQTPVLPGRSRSWAVIATVAGAAIVGSLTVWLLMRNNGTPSIDAAQVAIDVDAPTAMAAVVADAAVVEDPPAVVIADAASEPTVAVDAAAKEVAPVEPDLHSLIDRGRYPDAFRRCVSSLPDAALCTRAACQLRKVEQAKAWYSKIVGSRSRVAAQCRDAGVELEKKKVSTPRPDAGVDRCDQNPLDCQH